MPASPIGVKLRDYPRRWKWKQKVIIPDENTGTFFKIWYEEKGGAEKNDWYAWLMWCPFDEHGVDNWGHVEELTNETRHVLDTIEMVFDISFHESIWVELGVGNKLPSGPVAIGRGETWDGE